MNIEPTPLELAVIAWLAENASSAELREQLVGALVTSRKFSGAGSYTEVTASAHAPPLPRSVLLLGETGPIEGPAVQSDELPTGACTLLWLSERKVSTLEIAGSGIGERHPAQFTLSSPRNAGA
jgi:hypothetical protein